MKATDKTGGAALVAASIGKVALVATAFCVATAPSPSFADAKSATLKATGYKGAETLDYFPALVKLSATDDAYGFSYGECVNGKEDLWFTDADGNLIPHDVDTWNETGDSYVWVRIPNLTSSSEIVMHWGATRTAAQTCTSSDTWAGYVGVWHMNETGTNAEPDSTGHGLNAEPKINVSGTANINSTADGAIGNGRQNQANMNLRVSSYSLTSASAFTVSGWFKQTDSTTSYPRLLCGNPSNSDRNYWELWRESASTLNAIGGGSGTTVSWSSTLGTTWHYYTLVYNGTTATLYDNGTTLGNKTVKTPKQSTYFTIGCAGSTGKTTFKDQRSFVGIFDEVRMYNGVASKDRVDADYKTMNEPTTFLTLASVEVPVNIATLTHRWSFNGTTDAECLADSVGGSSYAAAANGDCVTFKDGKAELHGHGNGTGYVNLGANLLNAEAATLEMWVTKHGTVNWSRVFEYSVNNKYFIIHCWSNGKNEKCTLACYSNGNNKFDTTISDFAYDCETPYHVSMTIVANGDGSSTIRIMARDTKTGALVLDRSGTASGWTLDNYANPSLKLGYSTSGDKDGFAAYDEVRVYSGVVGDGQLSANAVAGPDALLSSSPTDATSGFSVSAGSKFVISSTNAVSVSGAATFGAGAKIRFDVSGFFEGSASFTAGSYSISGGGSLADIVELSDSVNYQATVSGNTVTVSPSAAFANVAVAATWKGGATAPDAAALANAANWASTNAYGAAVSAVPSQYTAVTIPAGSTAFTIPEGYTPNWRSVKFAPVVSTMRWARKKYSGDRSDIDVAWKDAVSWRDMPFADYDTANGTSANFSSLGWAAADWAKSQRRFDGWFYVSPAEAGAWRFSNSYDDYFAFAVDGEWVMNIITYGAAHRCTRNLKAGWHRFTIVCGDTYGGYSSSLLLKVSVNGGSERNFDALTFGSGPAQTITLADDCDWSALGELSLDADVTIDLNGHNLKIGDMAADFIGAAVTNSSAAVSTIYFVDDPMHTKAHSQGFVKEAGTKIRLMQSGARIARWTGAVDGDVSKPGNWDISFDDGPAPVTLPNSDYTVVVSGDNVNMQVPSGATLACAAVKVQDCTFAADCDWRGLSVTPDIVGTADLAGHNLQLNDLAADSGSSFANSSAAVSQVRLPVAIVNGAVTDEGLDNLSVASNVQVVMINNGSTTASADSPIGYLSGSTSGFVQTTGGSLDASGKALELGKKSGGTGLFRIEAGTAKISTINAQSVAGANALVELAGGELQASAFYLGNSSSGSAIVNQTGGTFTGSRVKTGDTSNGDFRIGHDNGGTGVYNLTGGKLTTKGTGGGGLLIGYAIGATGYMTVGGAGVVDVNDGVVGRQGTGCLTITNGGTVTARQAFIIGGNANKGNGVGTVKLTGGKLDALGGNTTYREILVGRYRTGTLDIGGDGVVNASYGVLLGREEAGNGTLKLSGNGVLNTSKIVKGSGTASVVIDGGTLVAKNASDGAFIDVDTLDVGAGTIDTDGHNVTVTAGAVNLSESGGSFTKTGAGTLTFPAMPSTDALTVEAGTLALSLPAAVINRARLAHRWSFNGSTEEENLADSVGGAVAGKIGDGVSFADGAVTLSGNGNSKGSLRLGAAGAALLGTGEGATVEIWATRNDVKKWARAFDYGNNQNWWWHLTWNNDTNGTRFEVGGCRNNNTKTTSYDAPWADGTKVYIVATFKANYNGTGNPYMKWAVYDATTRELLASNGFAAANGLALSDLSSATFYLGHSQYSGDYDAAATYDEVRLWRNALPDDAIAKSVEFGPDATAEQIAAIETMAVPRTVTVAAGATLDLGGGVLSQPCVNGFGTVQNGTLNVTGVISPGGDGVVGTIAMPGGTVTGEIRIDGGDIVRVVGGGTLDLSAATLTLAGVPTAPFDVAVVADGAAATITGLPAFAVSDGSSPHGWQLRILDGGKRLRVCRKGVTVIVY